MDEMNATAPTDYYYYSEEFCTLSANYFMCSPGVISFVRNFEQYGIYAILPFAFLGNILTIVVTVSEIRKNSSSWYIFSIVITDSFYLCVRAVSSSPVVSVSNMTPCKIAQFLLYLANTLSVWLIVAMTTERLFVVMFPLKATRYLSVKISASFTEIIFVSSVYLACPALGLAGTFDYCNRSECGVMGGTISSIWSTVIKVMETYIPIPVLIINNSLIIVAIYRAKQFKSSMDTATNAPKHSKSKSNEKEITQTLVIVSVVFLVLNLPSAIMNIVFMFTIDEDKDTCTTKLEVAKTVAVIADFLLKLSHGLNGYLYCLRSKKFRDRLKMILCCKDPTPRAGFTATNQTRSTTVTAIPMTSVNNI
ncbi:uncharacterized protein LOC141914882 [Tubulanus polymorphus]|uniref:uncharacterized protein LOC141914882 n=1 Tax=Tubulanus polymorphus TaxID=672921 RepID=UPI003DA222AD